MKNCLIALLAMAFLWPAFAFADSYCVSFPTSGESKWTKRDNTIQVRFRYDFKRPPGGGGAFSPPFWQTSGVLKGSGGTNRSVDSYTSYPYGTRDLCIESPIMSFNNRVVFFLSPDPSPSDKPSEYKPHDATEVRLDVKWGGDCQAVAINDGGRLTGTHKFEIYHRKGDLVNPFGCRRK